MSQYYPLHVFDQTATQALPSHAHGVHSVAPDVIDISDGPAVCSVKGCSSVLPDYYGLKMCEDCRSKHRFYASTKRAKRRKEKEAVSAGGWSNPLILAGGLYSYILRYRAFALGFINQDALVQDSAGALDQSEVSLSSKQGFLSCEELAPVYVRFVSSYVQGVQPLNRIG